MGRPDYAWPSRIFIPGVRMHLAMRIRFTARFRSQVFEPPTRAPIYPPTAVVCITLHDCGRLGPISAAVREPVISPPR